MLGAGITVYPAYLLYQVLIPADKQKESVTLSKTRLSELAQQLQLVSLQIHRLQAELILGRQLYRLKSLKDKNTTYLGLKVDNHDGLRLMLRDKWSHLHISKANRNRLQAQQNNAQSKTPNSSESVVQGSQSSDDVSLMQYLRQSGPDIYLHWPSRDAYFIMTTATSSKPTVDKVREFLQQTPLQQFIVALPVNSQQRIIDKLQRQVNLTEKIREVSQHYYFLEQWQIGNGYTAWLLRVNLEGPQGLSAALLPTELALLRNHSLPLFAKPAQDKTEYSAVVFDLRTVSIKPGLFPRIITPSGESVYTVSQTDPNLITRKGAMAYSRSLPSLLLMLGEATLIIPVHEIRGSYGLDWVVSEADASKIIAANQHSGLFFEGRIGVWLAN